MSRTEDERKQAIERFKNRWIDPNDIVRLIPFDTSLFMTSMRGHENVQVITPIPKNDSVANAPPEHEPVIE